MSLKSKYVVLQDAAVHDHFETRRTGNGGDFESHAGAALARGTLHFERRIRLHPAPDRRLLRRGPVRADGYSWRPRFYFPYRSAWFENKK